MASGINNTFRQVGIATGIAGLGAIFQHKIHGTDRVAFVSAMNAILLVAAIVAFVGAAAGLALVRGRDFVRPQQRKTRAPDAHADLPRGDQQHHGGAGDDDERLSGDRERDRLRLRHAGEREERRAGAGLHRSAGRADRHRRRGGRGAEEAEREREGALHREARSEAGRPRCRGAPRRRRSAERGERLLPALRVLAEPAADAVAHDATRGRELRQERDDERGGDARDRDDEEAGANRPGVRVSRGDRRERRERGVVEHADDDRLRPIVPSPARVPGKRLTQAMRTASSTRPGIATPPTHAAPPANASAPAVGRSCRREEALPAPRLEGVGDEKEDSGGDDEDRVRVVQRPAALA